MLTEFATHCDHKSHKEQRWNAWTSRPWRSLLWLCCCHCCCFALWTVSCLRAVVVNTTCSKLHLSAKFTRIFSSSRSWWHWYRWGEECGASLAPLHGLAADSRSSQLWRVAHQGGLCPHSSALSTTYVRIGTKIELLHFFNTKPDLDLQ